LSILNKILSYFLLSGYLLSLEPGRLLIYGDSASIILDTSSPGINLVSPDGGENYPSGDPIFCSFSAIDDYFDQTPVTIYISGDIGQYFVAISDSLPNTGYAIVSPPEMNTGFARLQIKAVDHFGNISSDTSQDYFTIGNPGSGNEQDSLLTILDDSLPITFDTVNPTVFLSSPNGGESFDIGSDMNIQWDAVDDSFTDTSISIYLSSEIGSLFEPLITGISNSGTINQSVPEMNTAFVLLKIEAVDIFGNTSHDESEDYFTVGEPIGFSFDDTLMVILTDSDSIVFDTIDPIVDLISPNGGEQFNSGDSVAVEWYAYDDSFTGEDIDIAVATEIGGWFVPIEDNIPNAPSYDVQLPEMDMAFVRLKLTATDYFGNGSSDFGDDYFILGDPFGDFNADEVFDFIVLNWGWGLSHLVVIRSEALNFLNPGDEIHIVDEQGIIEEECPTEPGQGIGSVSVANAGFQSEVDSLYLFSCTGSVDLCALGGPRLPGYVNGNLIHFFVFEASVDSVYEIFPESFELGEGVFGEPVTVISSFNQNLLISSETIEYFATYDRTEPEFSYNLFRNGDPLTSDYSLDYYIDQDVISGSNYCYIIDLLDSEDNVIMTSNESCTVFGSVNILPGDITQDQIVNVLDIVLIVDYILNNIAPTEIELIASDLNGDFVLNVIDLVILVELILNQ